MLHLGRMLKPVFLYYLSNIVSMLVGDDMEI